MCGRDEWSLWAQQAAKVTGVTLELVLARWKDNGDRPPDFSPEELQEAWDRGREPWVSDQVTKSVYRLLARATKDASGAGLTPGAVHLVGAYIYGDGYEADLAAWGFDRERWAAIFYPRIERHDPALAKQYRPRHERYYRAYSVGVRDAIVWAGALVKDAPVSARALLQGVVVDGGRFLEQDYACSWFVHALGGDAEVLLGGPPPEEPGKPGTNLEESAHALLEQAALFATACRTPEIHVRHLLLAALSSSRFPAPELLSRGRRKVRELTDEYLNWLLERDGEKLDDKGTLRELFDLSRAAQPPSEGRAVTLHNDEAHGDDSLDVRDDAHAMAAVLASKDLKPPLSIGLFGDWGSGKSFFMSLLRKRIGALADMSRAASKSAFHREIVQIEFNAWQYMDANLWASMIAHIFDQLSAELRKRDKPEPTKYLVELESIREKEAKLLSEKEKVDTALDAVSGQLSTLEQERKNKRPPWSDTWTEILRLQEEDPDVKQSLDEVAARLRLDRSKLTVDGVRNQYAALHSVPNQIAAWARSVRASPWKLLFVLPLLVPAVAPLFPGWEGARSWLIKAGSAVFGALAFLWQLGGVVVPGFRAVTRAMDRADAAKNRAQEKVTQEERKAQAEQERLAAEASKLEAQRAELAKRREALEAKLAELKEAATYKRFVLDRAASADYRGHLGLISTIHRDLKTLSQKLEDASDEPHVDRIILYIDDLDRCPPDRVVEVLQAVHLILSLKLFVVVVAVDSRWLLQSLEAYYQRHFGKRRLGAKRQTDPQHYLEKIFQIPYALPPMSDRGFAQMVGKLLERNVVKKQAAAPASASGEPASSGGAPATGAPPTAQASEPVKQTAAEPASNLTPKNLEITEAELRNLQRLGPLLSSPRAVKRLVNLYRIIRAGLDDDSVDELLQGRFRLTQLFLAAVVGAPRDAATLCEAIFDKRVSNRAQLTEYLAARRDLSDTWHALDAVFSAEQLLGDWTAVMDAARGAARFSFQTGRSLQGSGGSRAPTKGPTASQETPAQRRQRTPPPS